jgi:hypothetical protein
MSTRRCIKFSIVVFLQLVIPTGFGPAYAQSDLNLQSRTEGIAAPFLAPPVGLQTPEQPRPRTLHHPPKRQRASQPKQNR